MGATSLLGLGLEEVIVRAADPFESPGFSELCGGVCILECSLVCISQCSPLAPSQHHTPWVPHAVKALG